MMLSPVASGQFWPVVILELGDVYDKYFQGVSKSKNAPHMRLVYQLRQQTKSKLYWGDSGSVSFTIY
jgi:hypothetical protein